MLFLGLGGYLSQLVLTLVAWKRSRWQIYVREHVSFTLWALVCVGRVVSDEALSARDEM